MKENITEVINWMDRSYHTDLKYRYENIIDELKLDRSFNRQSDRQAAIYKATYGRLAMGCYNNKKSQRELKCLSAILAFYDRQKVFSLHKQYESIGSIRNIPWNGLLTCFEEPIEIGDNYKYKGYCCHGAISRMVGNRIIISVIIHNGYKFSMSHCSLTVNADGKINLDTGYSEYPFKEATDWVLGYLAKVGNI